MPYRLQRDAAVAWFLAAWPIPVGLTIALFNERFTSRSWRFASGIPGGYTFWSGALLGFGAVMLFAVIRHTLNNRDLSRDGTYLSGLFGVGLWWVTLGVLFGITAARDQYANPLGATTWTGIGLLYWLWALYEQQRVFAWCKRRLRRET